MVVTLENISKSFGASLVLENITAKIEDRDRIGLIGVNGAGKSTLLNILYGDLEADTGTVARSAKSFGFLRQNSGLDNAHTIIEEMRAVFAWVTALEQEMRDCEQEIAACPPESDAYEALAAAYAALQLRFDSAEGYMTEVKIRTVLHGMGFGDTDPDTPVDVLSGGERTRLAICKLLLEEPELLIMDEPTNHLDFRTLMWLEQYLQSYKKALLVVSHDRYFLDKICGTIWEMTRQRLYTYPGNYTKYLSLKDERFEVQMKQYEQQQEEIADLKDFVARNLVRASTTGRAKSRQKKLDSMELIPKPQLPEKAANIRFTHKREPVKDVLLIEKLGLSVGEGEGRRQLFGGLDFGLMRGDKIALIGANGIGKSTLLKALVGLHERDGGQIEWGKNTDISYFEQGESGLNADKTALNELWDRFPREYEHSIRTALGHVRITGENVYKRVGNLSGGERARLKFAALTLDCGNMLIMDEPTNHLDLATKEALDGALRDYSGTLLVVSHDRYLLNKFPTMIAEMDGDGIRLYPGNYDAYLAAKSTTSPAMSGGQPARESEKPAQEEPSKEKSDFYRSKKERSEEQASKRRQVELEVRIEELELEIFRLEGEIADEEVAADYLRLQEHCDLLTQRREELDATMEEWAGRS